MSFQNFYISQHPDEFDNYDDSSWLNEDFGLDQESDRTIKLTTSELLTLKLWREAISWNRCA